jgi:hypothetical protein
MGFSSSPKRKKGLSVSAIVVTPTASGDTDISDDVGDRYN